jgi:hypothetical protein
MEEENKIKIETPVPMDLNRKVPPYFLVAFLVVLVVGILSYLLFFKNIFPVKFAPKGSPVVTEKPQITILTKKYELSNEKGVQVYLSSIDGNTEVSAFQMKFLLPKGTTKDDVVIKVNPGLEEQAWKFPIARFEEEDGSPVVKFSGFRLGNSPYVVKGNLLLATISTKTISDLTLTLDTSNTLLYSSDAVTKIPFNSLSE